MPKRNFERSGTPCRADTNLIFTTYRCYLQPITDTIADDRPIVCGMIDANIIYVNRRTDVSPRALLTFLFRSCCQSTLLVSDRGLPGGLSDAVLPFGLEVVRNEVWQTLWVVMWKSGKTQSPGKRFKNLQQSVWVIVLWIFENIRVCKKDTKNQLMGLKL